MRVVLPFLLIGALTGLSLQQSPTFDRAEVERIITALASDEMAGRATFSPGADRAAEFIAGEFASIGLTELDERPDFDKGLQCIGSSPSPIVLC